MVLTTRRPGSDRRLQVGDRHALAQPSRSHLTQEELDAEVDQVIEAAHRRRLEAATRGRLTFAGDRIVRKTTGTGDGC